VVGNRSDAVVGRWAAASELFFLNFFLIFFWYSDSSSSSHHRSATIFHKNWYIKFRSEKKDSKKNMQGKKKGRYKRYLLVLERRINNSKATVPSPSSSTLDLTFISCFDLVSVWVWWWMVCGMIYCCLVRFVAVWSDLFVESEKKCVKVMACVICGYLLCLIKVRWSFTLVSAKKIEIHDEHWWVFMIFFVLILEFGKGNGIRVSGCFCAAVRVNHW